MDSEIFVKELENKFRNCADFAKRVLTNENNQTLTVLYIINLCDKKYITEGILKPISSNLEKVFDKETLPGILATLPLSECIDINDAVQKILSGNALITGEYKNKSFSFVADARSEDGRSISEPDSEAVVRGPRKGFVENAMVNLTLIRKIIRSEKLKVINKTFGNKTNTDIKIVYYEGIAKQEVLDELLKRLTEIDMGSCVDSGFLELKLQSKKFNLFSEVGNSEKPDKVASKILGGRIAIICDGSPVVLTVPYLFTESIQSAEDYTKSIYYATFIRVLRFLGMMLAIYLPAIYVAINEFHKGALPYSLYKTQMQTRSNIPFDIFTEMLVVLIIFEIIREVGVRMPKAVGDALSVVGGLILGDAAIKAGITSETVIVIVALTGICNFMNPTYMNTNVLLRFANLFLAKIFGFFGISTGFILTLCILCSKKSFGVPFMTPFTPISENILKDTIIMKPYAANKQETSEID